MDDMQTPVSVFVTFECEEGHARALKYSDTEEKKPQEKVLGQVLEIQEASEPSDIIW